MAVHHEQSARCVFNFAAAPAADLMSTGTQLQSSLPPSAVATSTTCSVGAITVGGNGHAGLASYEDGAYFQTAPYHYQQPQALLRYFTSESKDPIGSTPPPPVPTFAGYDSAYDKLTQSVPSGYGDSEFKAQRFVGLGK